MTGRKTAKCLFAASVAAVLVMYEMSSWILPLNTRDDEFYGDRIDRSTFLQSTDSYNTSSLKENPEWSDGWPKINLRNCSRIEYMNQGINAPYLSGQHSYPRTGIVSAPGSGNSWLRHLLQQATGLWTGSVFTDRSLYDGGLKGEMNDCWDNSTVAIKVHWSPMDVDKNCTLERAILIVRDPHRAILAEFNRQFSRSHTGLANSLNNSVWLEFIPKGANQWAWTTKTWLDRFRPKKVIHKGENPYIAPSNSSKKLLMVSYERLKRDTMKEMERIMDFLGLPTFRKNCVQKYGQGNFQRVKKPSTSAYCLYDDKGREFVSEKIKNLGAHANKIGIGDITGEFERNGDCANTISN